MLPQILEVVRHPHLPSAGAGAAGESVAMTGEGPGGSQEEEQRHMALMAENEQLKKQLAEVMNHVAQTPTPLENYAHSN
jgi:hypothetical protein